MEKKIINVEIQSNVDSASKQFDKLTKSIKETDKSATNLDATFEEVYGDLQPLTTRMGEAEDRLYELALAGKQTSQEYKDLLQSVAGYRRVQIQTDMVVDAASVTLGQKLGGSLNAVSSGFELVQGSMGLFGEESKDVEQAILKVQSAMAISSGIQGIQESVKSVQALGTAIKATTIFQKAAAAAQYVWNTAMAANPIGVVVASITALLVGGYKLIKFFKDSSEANEAAAKSTIKNTNALKQQSVEASKSTSKLKTYNDQQYALAQASGASSEELRKLALKHKDEEIALNKKNAILAQSTFLRERDTLASLKNSDASDEVIANQEKLTQETYKSFKKQNEILSASYKERAALRNSNQVAEVAERKAANDKAIEDTKAAAKEAREKRSDLIKEDREKMALQEEEFQISLDALKKSQIEKKDAADLLEIEKNNAKNKAFVDSENVRTNAEAILAQSRIEDAQAEADAKLAIQNAVLDNIGAGISIFKQLGEKNKAIQKAAIIAENAAGIARIIINTKAANAKAIAASPLTVGQPWVTINTISGALGVAGSLLATRKALAELGGGSVSGASIGSGGSSAPEPLASAAPSFNVVGTSGQNQIAQTLGNQAPVKAYVVSGDVSTAQALDRNIVKTASI